MPHEIARWILGGAFLIAMGLLGVVAVAVLLADWKWSLGMTIFTILVILAISG